MPAHQHNPTLAPNDSLSQSAAQEIRLHLSGAVMHRFSEKELKDLRAELADTFNMSATQVTSIGAWLKIKAKQAIAAAGAHEQIQVNDLISCFHFTVTERRDLDHGLALELKAKLNLPFIPPENLLHLLTNYLDLINSTNSLKSHNVEYAVENIVDQVDRTDSSIVFSGNTGAFTDYNFRVKNIWREYWESFLDQHLPPYTRRNLKVLCLPGRNCEVELSIYTRLGIRPENITCVELEGEIWPEFSRRVRSFGAVPIFGDLADLVATFKEPFDVVALDFVGPYSWKVLTILNELPSAQRTILMINLRCARESNEIQDQIYLDHMHFNRSHLSESKNPGRNVSASRPISSNPYQNIINEVLTDYLCQKTEVEESIRMGNTPELIRVRDDTVSIGVLSALGLTGPSSKLYHEFIHNMSFVSSSPEHNEGKEFRVYGKRTTFGMNLVNILGSLMGAPGLPDSWIHLPSLAEWVVFANPMTRAVERYKYQTAAASGHHFLSNFAVIERDFKRFDRWESTIRPIAAFFSKTFGNTELGRRHDLRIAYDPAHHPATSKVKFKRGKMTVKPELLKSITIKSQEAQAKIDIRRAARDLQEFKDWQSKFVDIKKLSPPRLIE